MEYTKEELNLNFSKKPPKHQKTLDVFVLEKKDLIKGLGYIIKEINSTELSLSSWYKVVILLILMDLEGIQFMERLLMMKIFSFPIIYQGYFQWQILEKILMGLNFL